ncbi:MAG: fumarylacetoacetate hydrolase family protein [Gammaproteobacteria bacterium]|nr:fumarylacetoacetate hydrolase family protein [Gammaproteobacteria bacterium]MCP4879744.1 fumarylacetoacetate hydrolase family protein [Gammaproteobacteria bacterium]
MKLASLKNNTRDGELVVVSKDLSCCAAAPQIAPTMQFALDNWNHVQDRLTAEYEKLNNNASKEAKAFNQEDCCSPLPRAFQWADGSAYVNHVELVRKARGAELPNTFWEDPLIYQGGADSFLSPHDDIETETEAYGVDFEAEIAVVVSDVPMGSCTGNIEDKIKLLMLVNDVSLRNLIPTELAKGFGFFQSKPSSAFSPVAVTPDELGASWGGGKVSLPLRSVLNNELFGIPNAGVDMTFNFFELVAHAAKTRPLTAGTIIGSGTVSNKSEDGGCGEEISKGGKGYSCIAELRMIETITYGQPKTEFMKFGDTIQIEMLNDQGLSIFGAINQKLVPYKKTI